jgi:hypothetical protein
MAIDREFEIETEKRLAMLGAVLNIGESVTDLTDPVCKCGHVWSDHAPIHKLIPSHENPKDVNSSNWKKISTTANMVDWLCEDKRGFCRRTPSGMRCKCACFERKDS